MIAIEFDSVVYLERSQYTRPLKEHHPAGSLFLLGKWGEAGGLLKLTRNKFVTVSREQAFGLSPLVLDGREFWISGEGRFELKRKGAEAPGDQKFSLNSSSSSSLSASVVSSSALRSKG